MATLHVGGDQVGSLQITPKAIAEFIERNHPLEIRDEAGVLLGRLQPVPKQNPERPIVPWEPDLTEEEIERRLAEPGFTFEEVKKQLGWE